MNAIEYRWKKVPGMSKWAGYYAGKHCATILQHECGHTRLWLDAGLGFQEVIEIKDPPVGLKQWKRFATYAYWRLLQEHKRIEVKNDR